MNRRKKILSWILSVAMIFSLLTAFPVSTNADDGFDGVINVVDGTGTGAGWTYASGEIWINQNGSYHISGDGIQAFNRIRVNAGITAVVTLDNVNINVNLPFDCGENSNVTVILPDDSENILNGYGGHAGLRVAPTATLTIGTTGQSKGNGSLAAYGGADSSSNWACAGIGGSELESSGAIIINGGTIYAKGGDGRPPGAWRGPGAAGIGGAQGRACGDITINGGYVTAVGGNVNPEGAGIGGGSSDPSTYVGKITINGGTVRAYSGQSGSSGTGIGFCSAIAISHAADVMAFSSGDFPAIYGTTDASGHDAILLSFMLDAKALADTDITVVQRDDAADTFGLTLPNGYKNFASTVGTANDYTARSSDGSMKVVSLADGGTDFPGICDGPGTAFSYASVKLKLEPVCRIGTTEYETLDSALAAVTSGQTIELMRDIAHNTTITMDTTDFVLNLDLNGHDLTIKASGSSCLAVINGAAINVTDSAGDGMLIANTTYDGSIALIAESYGTIIVDAPLTINALSTNSWGIRTYAAGSVTVMNAEINATRIGVGAYGDWNNHTDASTVNVTGTINTLDDNADYGAYAYSGGVVTIHGEVASANLGLYAENGTIEVTGEVTGKAFGAYSYGGNIDVTGNVTATGDYSYGAYAYGGTIEVCGDIYANGTDSLGAYVLNAATIKVDGEIHATSYVSIGGIALAVDNTYEPTTLEGYRTYAIDPDFSNVVWVKRSVCTVIFNANGGSTVESLTAERDTVISPPATTRTGYTLAGWYKDSALTDAWDFASDKVTSDITLYAKWTPNTYSIKFNGNGSSSGSMASLAMTYNTSKVLTANAYKKTGYTFLGWAKTPTGAVAYKDKSSVNNLTSVSRATVNLYAKWGAPIISATSAGYTSIKVNWATAGSATSYKIYRATSATGKYTLVKTATSTSRSWTDTGRVTGKTYYYKVYPVAGGKTYTHSTYKYAKAVPSTPALTLSKASSTSVKVAWTGVSGATKYQIYRANGATGTYGLVYTASSTLRSWTDKSKTVGKTYYYKVRAYHLEGTIKVYSAFSAVKYLKI